MPELPEVQTVVATLRPRLVGRRLAAVRLIRQDIVEPAGTDLPALLTGRSVRAIDRRGKRIIITLDDGNRFFIHLGMTGQLTVVDAATAVQPHTHLLVDLTPEEKDGRGDGVKGGRGEREDDCKLQSANCNPNLQLRFRDPRRFGGIWWLGLADCDEGMGPEPLTVRPHELSERLSRTTRAIKNALLDQSVLAGLGNIYVDESLFLARIHPLTPANTLAEDQIARLNRAIKSTLRQAIRSRGSTLRDYRDANGSVGDYQSKHKVYGREGETCRTCRTPIERIVLGGRSTHFCPKCQPR
ncbi:MAG: formamidopyrimidine-DNA glycosylase [Phycisphaerales bacterium]|nr:formamidopyrimidine-DNA glycosylase [Phycisphaerales bacterium]